MKSQKAKELIEKYAVGNSRDAAPSMMKGRVIECVELAEQEAEERMRRKAKEAFISCCDCEEFQYDGKKCENCDTYKSFIQKLNGE